MLDNVLLDGAAAPHRKCGTVVAQLVVIGSRAGDICLRYSYRAPRSTHGEGRTSVLQLRIICPGAGRLCTGFTHWTSPTQRKDGPEL